MQNDAAWRKTRAEAGILIPAAHGAVHEESVGRGCLPERPLIVGCCALRLLPGLFLLSLFASLIIEVHLLEGAATPAGILSPGPSTGGARRSSALRCRAILTLVGSGRASAARGAAGKLPAPQSPRTRLLPCRWRVVAAAASGGSISTGIGRRSCARGSLARILRRSRRSFEVFERRNFERHIDRSRCFAQIEFLGGVLKSQLAHFHSVVPRRQSRQIEMAVFVCPTDPSPPGVRFHQTKIRAGNRHTICRANGTRSSSRRRRLRRRRLLLCAHQKRWQGEKEQECEAKSAYSDANLFRQETPNLLDPAIRVRPLFL